MRWFIRIRSRWLAWKEKTFGVPKAQTTTTTVRPLYGPGPRAFLAFGTIVEQQPGSLNEDEQWAKRREGFRPAIDYDPLAKKPESTGRLKLRRIR